jgi:hypothetical protein
MWLISAMHQKQPLIARIRLEQLPQLSNVRGIPLPLLAELMGTLVTGLYAIQTMIVKSDINVRVKHQTAHLHAQEVARVMMVLTLKNLSNLKINV